MGRVPVVAGAFTVAGGGSAEDRDVIVFAFVTLALLALSAGAETVLVSADRIRIRRRIEAGGPRARYLHRVLADPRTALSATLASTAAFTVLTSALVTVSAGSASWAGAATVATIATVLTILVVGEVLPKTIGRARADTLFPLIAPLVYWMGILLWPVLQVATITSNLLLVPLGIRGDGRRGLLGRADLQVLLREAASDPHPHHRSAAFLDRVLDFGGTPVGDVLVPRTDLAAVEADTSPEEALRVAAETRHLRLVVYRESVDAVVGLVHAFDLLRARRAHVGELARPVPVLPESASSLAAFGQLTESAEHIALVTDEFGGVAGIVSISDLLEELTGSPTDEGGRADAPIRALGEHRWLVRGRTPVDDVDANIPGLSIPAGAYETIAGYLLARTGTIPSVGTNVRLGPWRLTVARSDGRRVLSVLVERVGTEPAVG